MPRRGLPQSMAMRHDEHYVDALAASAGTPVGRMVPIDLIEQLAQPGPVLAMLVELEDRGGDGEPRLAAGHGGDALAVADGVGQVLIEPFLHLRLVVVQVHLRRAADHVEIDHVLRFRWKVRQRGLAGRVICKGSRKAFAKERAERGSERSWQKRCTVRNTAGSAAMFAAVVLALVIV